MTFVHSLRAAFRLHWLPVAMTIAILAGGFFRFYRLDSKAYWNDEISTSLALSARLESYPVKELFNDQVLSPEQLQTWLKVDSNHGVPDTIKFLSLRDPHHVPLYSSLARLWVSAFGDSIAAIRSFSAFLGILLFPAVFWLCLELFASASTGMIAVTLLAISPLFLTYSQEAREYALLFVTLTLAAASFLRTLRKPGRKEWALHGALLALALYSSHLALQLVLVHTAYILAFREYRKARFLLPYGLVTFFAIAVLSPWLWIDLQQLRNIQQQLAWHQYAFPVPKFLEYLFSNFIHVFFDYNSHGSAPLAYPLLLVEILAFAALLKKGPKRPSLYLFLYSLLPIAVFVSSDVVLGGIRSTVIRYSAGYLLGIVPVLAWFFRSTLSDRLLARIALLYMSSLAIFSCIIFAQSDSWWTKMHLGTDARLVAEVINQAQRPLIITDQASNTALDLISLSHCVDPKAGFQLFREARLPIHDPRFSDVFVFFPSSKMKELLEQAPAIRMEKLRPSLNLWKLRFLP